MPKSYRLKPDSYSYIAMMKACAQGSQWQTALLFFDGSLGEISWNTAMTCCVKGTAWQIALEVFDVLASKLSLQRACPSEVSFGGAISACAQGSNWQLAIHLLREVSEQVVPSVISYSAAITSCGAEWRIAVHLLDTMLHEEILPNVITYNSLVNACEKGLQWELALHIFETCQKHFSVDSILRSSVISACGTASEWLIALHFFQNSEIEGKDSGEFSEGQAESESLVAAIVACERGCQWQFALQLLHAMLRLRLDDVTSCTASTAAISACENCGEWEMALAIFHLVPADAFTYSATISACETAGMWELALNLLENMSQYRLQKSGICCSAAISACRVPGQWQHACDLLQQISVDSLLKDDISCAATIGTCGQSSAWQHALDLVPHFCTEFTLGAAIGACAKGQAATDVVGIQIYRSLLQSEAQRPNQWRARLALRRTGGDVEVGGSRGITGTLAAASGATGGSGGTAVCGAVCAVRTRLQRSVGFGGFLEEVLSKARTHLFAPFNPFL
eukprot:Skav209868  [mRNA]  locus=scaffold590:61319:65784:+ [translate_table: standard]